MLALPRRLAALAVVAAVALGACGAEADDTGAVTTTTISGVSEVGRRRPWDGMILPPDIGPRYREAATVDELVELAELGAPNVALVVPLVDDPATGGPQRDPGTTPSDEALGRLMVAASGLDLGVIVQLRVDWPPEPSATVAADPGRWIRHYGRLAVHYAALAQRHGASLLVLAGAAGNLVVADEDWSRIVADIRQVYEGPLSFSVDAGEAARVTIWDLVDVIGVDVTFPPDVDDLEPVAADLEKAWEPLLGDLTGLAERWSRPVVLTRVGFPGVDRTTPNPTGVEADRQLRAYEALFTVSNQTPAIEGVQVWRWGSGPAAEAGGTYSPEDRPAEDVLRRAWTTPLADDASTTTSSASS